MGITLSVQSARTGLLVYSSPPRVELWRRSDVVCGSTVAARRAAIDTSRAPRDCQKEETAAAPPPITTTNNQQLLGCVDLVRSATCRSCGGGAFPRQSRWRHDTETGISSPKPPPTSKWEHKAAIYFSRFSCVHDCAVAYSCAHSYSLEE